MICDEEDQTEAREGGSHTVNTEVRTVTEPETMIFCFEGKQPLPGPS